MKHGHRHAHPPGFTLADEPLGDDGMIIVATGELDVAASSALRDHVRPILDAGISRLVVDLSDVSFIDSVSLAAIVGARRRLKDRAALAVVATHPYVRLILEAAGLDTIVNVFDTREDALQAVAGSSG
jgi:anti-sigma B factor antagonist